MAFFKITFHNGTFRGKRRQPVFVHHNNGSQMLFTAVDEIIGDAPHNNGIPCAIEIDGWGDDQACLDDTFTTDLGFDVTCITEEEFREETDQKDTGYAQLINIW